MYEEMRADVESRCTQRRVAEWGVSSTVWNAWTVTTAHRTAYRGRKVTVWHWIDG